MTSFCFIPLLWLLSTQLTMHSLKLRNPEPSITDCLAHVAKKCHMTLTDTLPPADSGSARTPFNSRQDLQEVSVSSRKPLIERQVDRLTLNVSADLIATGGNLLDVLQRAPGVSILNDETVNMAGKSGVNILIDGRPTQLAGKDLVNYLRSVPASMVDKIEIISNPPARYDAQGNAGVLNIRMKKTRARGTNGNLTGAWTQSVHARKNIAALVNHRTGRWNINANAGAGAANQFTDGRITRYVDAPGGKKLFRNTSIDQDGSRTLTGSLSVDWLKNRNNSFGTIIKTNWYTNPMFTPGQTLIGSGNQIDSSLKTINDNWTSNTLASYNFNYKFEDTLGTSFNIDADHTRFINNNRSFVSTDLLDRAFRKYGYTANDQRVTTNIRIYSLKMDFITRLFKRGRLEAGAKWNRINTTNNLRASYFHNPNMVPDTGRTNDFAYRESMLAGYLSLSVKKGKWELQSGLRGEQTVIKGKSVDLRGKTSFSPDSTYLNLFPTSFIKYAVSEKTTIVLAYSRRVNRPSYQELNPFEYIFDNYTREAGNPFLQPEYRQQLELGVSAGYAINITAGIARTSNLLTSVSVQTGDITRESRFNIGQSKQAYMNVSYNNQPWPWWSLYVNVSPFYTKYDGQVPAGPIAYATTGMGWYVSNNFEFGRGYKGQLSSWGNLATQDGIYYTKALGSVDAAAGKSFFNQTFDLRLTVLDIFNTQRWTQRVDFVNVNFLYHRKWESQAVRLQLTWKFGKGNYKARERSAGSETETDRIKKS